MNGDEGLLLTTVFGFRARDLDGIRIPNQKFEDELRAGTHAGTGTTTGSG